MFSTFPRLQILAVFAACLAITGCTARGGAPSDPIQRNAQWFSFVGGDDLRERCGPAAPARYRFVFNAIWSEQVRVYEIEQLPAGQGAQLSVEVIRGAPRLLQAYIIDSSAVGSTRAQARLSEAEFIDLTRALSQAGFDRMPADGTRLQSGDFYWLVTACTGGRWHLNAWRRQDPGFFDRLGFDRLLFAQDRTGVPVNPPRPSDPRQRPAQFGDGPGDAFELLIRNGRLFGNARLF